jgi:mRNA-degrading endonuclease RelE of RelBE toxin-antitoxin system
MKDLKRVHVNKSFVLVFSYNKQPDFFSFLDYDHYGNVYRQ